MSPEKSEAIFLLLHAQIIIGAYRQQRASRREAGGAEYECC
jgi:hypothetical protein